MTAVGKPVRRIDGPAKVQGKVRFTADQPLRGMVYAVPVLSSVPNGRITGFDLQEAERVPGVLTVLTYRNAPKLPYKSQPPELDQAPPGRALRPLEDDLVRFDRQYVALIVADTREGAEQAAALVRVSYHRDPAVTSFEVAKTRPYPPGDSDPDNLPDYQRGNSSAGYAHAATKIDATYSIPAEHHNPIETMATTAVWLARGRLTVFDKTQWPGTVRSYLACTFGLVEDHVRVVSPYVGGAFGGANRPWAHVVLAAMAAKVVRRPVQLWLSREAMYGTTGSRAPSEQRIRLGADASGKLNAIIHNCISATSVYEQYADSPTKPTQTLYACANVRTSYRLANMNISTPTFMRGPGESTGAFAQESAMDELAYKLKLDPIELRLRNYTEHDPQTGLPFSSKPLRQCYSQGAERFGWSRRTPTPGSMRDGRLLIGQGMASGSYGMDRQDASAEVILDQDGSAVVRSSSNDMGPGTYTSMAQVAADALGVAVGRIQVRLGDTTFPAGPMQAGSWLMASLGPAVQAAAHHVYTQAVTLAVHDRRSPLYGAEPVDVHADNGRLFLRADPSRGETYTALLTRRRLATLEAKQTAGPGSAMDKHSFFGFAAHFVEVSVDPDLLEVRVRRVVSAIAAGRIINPRTADSQVRGAIIGGLGAALMEQTRSDPSYGRITNANLADYLIPVSADIPRLETIFIADKDPYLDPLGAKGIGELPIIGVAAAVANAVHHATGIRARDLPITIDKLLSDPMS